MSQKQVIVDGIGTVLLQRRKGTKHLRLSIRSDGRLRVSIPSWVPYKAAEAFVLTQKDWIAKHQPDVSTLQQLPDGALIGKYHRLVYMDSPRATRVTTRISGTELRVIHPIGLLYRDAVVQRAAVRVAEKALKSEAEQLLPMRLQELATKHGFSCKDVSIKRLHTRWGSCSSNQEIVLNSMLMQLPWNCIDYVIMHELLHTRLMRHGAEFWAELARFVPELATRRRDMKTYSPSVIAPRTVANPPTN